MKFLKFSVSDWRPRFSKQILSLSRKDLRQPQKIFDVYGSERFKSEHIYQLYAYLRSQEGQGILPDGASGMLLYPSLDLEIDERVTIKGHELRFATVNLALPGNGLRQRLLQIVGEDVHVG